MDSFNPTMGARLLLSKVYALSNQRMTMRPRPIHRGVGGVGCQGLHSHPPFQLICTMLLNKYLLVKEFIGGFSGFGHQEACSHPWEMGFIRHRDLLGICHLLTILQVFPQSRKDKIFWAPYGGR